jgi:hypothetical protein
MRVSFVNVLGSERRNHEDTKTLRFVRDFAPNEGRCE